MPATVIVDGWLDSGKIKSDAAQTAAAASMSTWRNPGILAAFGAAVLFGAGTPFAKLLLGPVSPWLLAGVLYLGSGAGLAILRFIRQPPPMKLARGDAKWLAGAIVAGGVVGPVLLMWGLSRLPASTASLMLNAEGVFTALLAWFVFRENFDRRIAFGMALIVAGAVALAWPGEAISGAGLPALAVLGACFAWALDNNLTRKVSLADATFIAMAKGLAAGLVNVAIALLLGAHLPSVSVVAGAAALGFVSYGLSLVLFVLALRHLGTARTGAYFSTAPFVGALIAVPLLSESITVSLMVGGALMAAGVWLHLTEHHGHPHAHGSVGHEHEHVHDEHHRHMHAGSGSEPHAHWHEHEPMTHSHEHYPDAHHRHGH